MRTKTRIKTKEQLFQKNSHKPCCYCNKLLTFKEATIEHVPPRAIKGSKEKFKFEIACEPCNHRMGLELEEVLRPTLSIRVFYKLNKKILNARFDLLNGNIYED